MSEGLVQYVCERCHTRFVLALSGRKLSPANEVRAGFEAARLTLLRRNGSYADYLAESTRRIGQGLADAEYERFRRSFNFCHNCRQFVCSDCWNETQRQCLTCAPRKALRAAGGARLAKGPMGPTLEPDGPQINRPLAGGLAMAVGVASVSQVSSGPAAADTDSPGARRRSGWPARTTLVLAALVLALVVVNLSSWQLGNAPPAAHAADSGTPTASLIALGPTSTPAVLPSYSPTPEPTPTLTPSPSPSPTAAPTPPPTPRPTPPPTPKPTPTPTPKPKPTPTPPPPTALIACSPNPNPATAGGNITCSNFSTAGATYAWYVGLNDPGSLAFYGTTSPVTQQLVIPNINGGTDYYIQLWVTKGGKTTKSTVAYIHVT